ncbi:type I toxin-antitoxin system Fst family toxin [Staphylococcus caeli]|nr:type I toxin-antitoxin system Fst family toxin [Staphylococcus caeli]
MFETLFQIATAAISGCIVTWFAHWLSKHDDHKTGD